MADTTPQLALGDVAARQLANATKTVPQMSTITPRWLPRMLPWVGVEAGIYRLNRVKDASRVLVACSRRDERDLPETFVDYDEAPREYMLSAVTTIVDIHTRVSDLYSVPHDQIAEQLRLTIETVKEKQDSELINNKEYGLLNSVAPSMRISTRNGAPTPDDFDELIAKVWKEPAFFLAHRWRLRRSPVNAHVVACHQLRSLCSVLSSLLGAGCPLCRAISSRLRTVRPVSC